MAVNTNNAFKAKLRSRNKKPIYLYTIWDYDGSDTNLYYAAWSQNVTFDGITYNKFPITHDKISENADGAIDSNQVQLSNISRLIEYYLQNYDLRGKKVSVKLVDADMLDDPDAYIEFSNYIDSYTSNVKDVIFNLTSKFNLIGLSLPTKLWLKDYCQWEFASPAIRALGRGDECGYTGEETECDRTWQRCQALGNSRRFLGARGIPGRRGYV